MARAAILPRSGAGFFARLKKRLLASFASLTLTVAAELVTIRRAEFSAAHDLDGSFVPHWESGGLCRA